jgi:dihydrolipoamide dehydrogenase
MSDNKSFDLVVIGGGPGGYVAAIRAAQLGMATAVIEKRGALGGTCLNVGCIPSKALLESSHLLEEAQHGMAAHGILVDKVGVDFKAMMGRKDKVVGDLTQGIAFLFKKNKVAYFQGTGQIVDNETVKVTDGPDKGTTLTADSILIATGSEVAPLNGVEIDEKVIVSSTGALALGKVPKTMIVIGAGYIGLELGTVWRRLGADVTVVEFLDRILPGMDLDVAKQMQRTLKRQGLKFRLGAKVTGAEKTRRSATLTVEPVAGGKAEKMKADAVLVSIGRRPYVTGLGLENVGITPNARGFLDVGANFQTTAPNVYAIGDVTPGPMLAHKAEEEGVACVEYLAGQRPHVNYGVIPGVVYTWPEAASVGRTEEELKTDGVAYRVGKFPFSANSRARAAGDMDGFVKILADAANDRVLGVHIIGPDAGTLIHEAVTAMEFGASAEDIARTCHAHPTLNEAVKEAALAVDKRTINM